MTAPTNSNSPDLLPQTRTKRLTPHDLATDTLTLWFDDTQWFPFIESESCDITGPGHQNPETFVQHIRDYDLHAGSDPDTYETHDPTQVRHQYAVIDAEGETLTLCSKDTPGAVPVTTLWNIR